MAIRTTEQLDKFMAAFGGFERHGDVFCYGAQQPHQLNISVIVGRVDVGYFGHMRRTQEMYSTDRQLNRVLRRILRRWPTQAARETWPSA